MIIDEITAALSYPVKETRFLRPPNTTYGVYTQSRSYRGCDCTLRLCDSDITLYLVQYAPDAAAEKELEKILRERGIEYTKQARTWIESDKFYQTIYDFQIVEKIKEE